MGQDGAPTEAEAQQIVAEYLIALQTVRTAMGLDNTSLMSESGGYTQQMGAETVSAVRQLIEGIPAEHTTDAAKIQYIVGQVLPRVTADESLPAEFRAHLQTEQGQQRLVAYLNSANIIAAQLDQIHGFSSAPQSGPDVSQSGAFTQAQLTAIESGLKLVANDPTTIPTITQENAAAGAQQIVANVYTILEGLGRDVQTFDPTKADNFINGFLDGMQRRWDAKDADDQARYGTFENYVKIGMTGNERITLDTEVYTVELLRQYAQAMAGIEAAGLLGGSSAAPAPDVAAAPATGYSAEQITAIEAALKQVSADPSSVSNLSQDQAAAGIADITRVAHSLVLGFNAQREFGVKDINEKLEAAVTSARGSWDALDASEQAKFEGGFDGFFAKIIERRFTNLDPAVHTPEFIMNYANAMKGLQAAGVFDAAEGSGAPAVEVRTFTPDAATTRAMTYIRESVFPKLGVSAGSSVADFRTNFTGAATGLATMLNLEGDPSTYPDQVRTKLDELANHSGLKGIRSTYEAMLPLGEDRAKAAVKELIRGLDSEMFGRLPQAMQNDPSLIFEVIDQKDQISAAVAQIYSSGVLDDAEVVVTSPTRTVEEGQGTGTETDPEAGADTDPEAGAGAGAGADPETGAGAGDGEPTQAQVDAASIVVENLLVGLGGAMEGMGGGLVSQLAGFTPPESADGNFDRADQDAFHMAIMGIKKLMGEDNPDGTYNASVGRQIATAMLDNKLQMVESQLPVQIQGEYKIENGQIDVGGRKINVFNTDPTKPNQYFSDEFLNSSVVAANGDKAALEQFGHVIHSMDILARAKKLDNERAREVNFMGTMMDRIGQFLPDSIKSWLQDFFENDQFGQMIGGLLTAFGFPVHKLWGGEAQGMEQVRPQVEQYYRTELEAAGFDHDLLKSRILERMDDSAAFKAVERLLFTGDETGLMRRSVEEALDAAALHAGDPDKAAEVFANHLIQAGEAFQGRQLTEENREEYFQTIRRAYEEEVRGMEGVPQDNASAGPAPITAAGERGPEIVPSDLTSVAADAEAAGNNGEFELVFTHNTTDYVQGPTRFSNGRVEILQSVMAQNSDALEMSTRPDAYMRSGGDAPDMMTRNTAMALEELVIRAQLAKGVEISQLSHDYNDATISAVEEYMREKGVADDDIARFTETIRDLQSDMKSTVPGNPTAGEAQEHSVWAQSYISNQVGVRATLVPAAERDQGLEDGGQPDTAGDRYPGIKMSDDNELPPGMTIDDVFQRYKDFNAPKGDPNCAPLVFEHEGKAYAAVVIEATNTFTVQELDGYLDKPEGLDSMNREEMLAALEGSKYQALSTSDYNLLHDNYNWRDGSRFGIQNYVNRMLCLDPLVIEPAPQVESDEPAAGADTGLGSEFRRSHDGDGALPQNYWQLPRLEEQHLNGLDGGHLDMRELNRLYDYSVSTRHIVNGGAMLTRLGEEDRDRLGGDLIVSVRNKGTGEIEHRLVNYEEHKIKIGNLTETWSPEASVRRLDDFLATGYNQMTSVVLAEHMGGILHPDYKSQHRYFPNDALRELYDRPGGMDSPNLSNIDRQTVAQWSAREGAYINGNASGDGYETRLMKRGQSYVVENTARVVYPAGSPHREEFGHSCGQPQTERVIDPPRHLPAPWGSGINTITDFIRVLDHKTGGGREVEISENARDCGAHIQAGQTYIVTGGYEPVRVSGDPTPGVIDPP